MNAKKFSYLLSAVLALLIIALFAGVYYGNALLQKQSKKVTDAKAQNMVAEQQKISLSQAKKDIDKYSELNEISKSIVPQDKDQAKTVLEINKIAAESGIRLNSITFASSNLGQQAPKPQATSSDGGDAAKATTPTAPPISQVKPVDGIKGVYALEINITTTEKDAVSYQSFIEFLEKLESNRRTAHVDKIVIKPTKDRDALSFSLTLNAYVKP
jgi:hypothetical protein